MRVVVTGAAGFLGWHLRCALRARGIDARAVTRADWAAADRRAGLVAGADMVFHLAGVNRGDPDSLRDGNAGLARELTAALDRAGARPALVYANSVQAGNGTPFGDGKLAAAEHLAEWGRGAGACVVDAVLPNLFGEHGRPHYNSVVATFCAELASGGTPVIEQDRELPLAHVQDTAGLMIDAGLAGRPGPLTFPTRPMTVSALLVALTELRDLYTGGDVPDTSDPFRLALFNTYRSFTFPGHFPIRPAVHGDQRGELFECARVHGGQSQVFCSTTRPGQRRGEHFHLRKVERFLVLRGSAQIALRRLFTDEVVSFEVSGQSPAIVDMPTMWAHSITNTGTDELVTLFWAHEILDPAHPDTYPEPVRPAGVEARA